MGSVFDALEQLNNRTPPPQPATQVQAPPSQLPTPHSSTQSDQAISTTTQSSNAKSGSSSGAPPEHTPATEKSVDNSDHPLTAHDVYVQGFLTEKATIMLGVRASQRLVDKFDEVQFLLKQRHHLRFTKHHLLVAALAHLFWEFESKGINSSLCTSLHSLESTKGKTA